jgi:hypothetical protein
MVQWIDSRIAILMRSSEAHSLPQTRCWLSFGTETAFVKNGCGGVVEVVNAVRRGLELWGLFARSPLH